DKNPFKELKGGC
nr:Chain A, Guanine nucleotide-binding protein G(T)gamma-T1 subunit [Bos taurus]